jgi:predicted metal-dependent hydrolase
VSTASAYLTVRGIDIDVIYKDIKNLHIGVYPPMGRVRVAAPKRFDDEQVRLAVIQRLSWIKKQREQLQTAQRQSEREMVSGETHHVWGRRHRLRLIQRPGRAHLEVDGERLLLYAPEGTTEERRRGLLEDWYRQQLRHAIPDLLSKWEPVIGATVPKWTIRRMKTKWGSCNRQSRHIWFNVELAKKHPESLEYIVVHEMTHYLERGHGARFTTLMDGFMPDWRARRDRLNAAPLAAEKWHDPRAAPC